VPDGVPITGEISVLWRDVHRYDGDVLLISLDTDEPLAQNAFEIRGALAQRLGGVLQEGMRVSVHWRAEVIEVVNQETGETSDEAHAVVVDVRVLGHP
jgi:hypothetical protein